jgi:hypothetical protein
LDLLHKKQTTKLKITYKVVNKKNGAIRDKKEKVSGAQDAVYQLFLMKTVY